MSPTQPWPARRLETLHPCPAQYGLIVVQINRNASPAYNGRQLENLDLYLDAETPDSLGDPAILRLPPAQRIHALRFGFAVTYDEVYGWRTWTTSLLSMLWRHLTLPGVRVVGWDVANHDLIIIRNAVQRPEPLAMLDLAEQIQAVTRRHYRLDTIARANLGRGKILDTSLVIDWLRAGDPDSMARVTEHCRTNVQLVMDLIDLIAQGKPLVLPGRQQPAEAGWARLHEATLRIFFTPQGEWLRCEDLHGHPVALREETDQGTQ